MRYTKSRTSGWTTLLWVCQPERSAYRNMRVSYLIPVIVSVLVSCSEQSEEKAEKSMHDRLLKEAQELTRESLENDKIQEWIRISWGKTESLSSAYLIDDVQFPLDNKSMNHRSSISEGLAESIESREESGSKLLDLLYSRGLLLTLLYDFDRQAFDKTLEVAIQNRGVDENITLQGFLFSPMHIRDVEKMDFQLIERLIATEDNLPQIISLGLIDLYLQLEISGSEEQLESLQKMLSGNNWVKNAAIAETRRSLLDEVQHRIDLVSLAPILSRTSERRQPWRSLTLTLRSR